MISTKIKLALAVAGFLSLGTEKCSQDSLEERCADQSKIAVVGEFIGQNKASQHCGKQHLYYVGTTWDYGREQIAVCFLFSSQNIPNWSNHDGLYQITLVPRKTLSGELDTVPFLNNNKKQYALFDGIGISALGLKERIHQPAELSLYDPSWQFCKEGERLYGFRIPNPPGDEAFLESYRSILVCGEGLDANSHNVRVIAESTPVKDLLGRPIYRAREKLQEL